MIERLARTRVLRIAGAFSAIILLYPTFAVSGVWTLFVNNEVNEISQRPAPVASRSTGR